MEKLKRFDGQHRRAGDNVCMIGKEHYHLDNGQMPEAYWLPEDLEGRKFEVEVDNRYERSWWVTDEEEKLVSLVLDAARKDER